MKSIHPYIIFHGQAEEAINFYASAFEVELPQLVRFKDMNNGESLPPIIQKRIAHASLPMGDSILMVSDSHDLNKETPFPQQAINIHVATESVAEAERYFQALSHKGQVLMPLEKTEWAERFGMCLDHFGVCWMIDYSV